MLPKSTWIVSEANAGLLAQALGLAEAAGLVAETREIRAAGVWRHVPAAMWPRPLAAIAPGALDGPSPELLIGCGGKAAAVLAALARRSRTVIVQHPRMNPRRFDLVMVARHDELTGPNVVVTRTALHRLTPARLAEAAALWAPRLAHLPRPLVAVLVGGANGRFRFDTGVAAGLADQLVGMLQRDGGSVVLTPSRRTSPALRQVFEARLSPVGGWVWDGTGNNPYLGMLALADMILVTEDSVSMMSEAVATTAPVMVAGLPGRSRRIGMFLRGLEADRRIRRFTGRLERWAVTPIDDTPEAAAEMCRRFGY